MDGCCGCQVKGSLWDLNDRELLWADISQEGLDSVIETRGALSWELEVSHEPVKDVDHESIALRNQEYKRHRLSVAR
jgi:hypothetical protein